MQIKAILILLFFCFIFGTAYTQPVSYDEAKKTAENVFASLKGTKKLGLNEDTLSLKVDNKTTLYIFNEKTSGFVIISADKRAYPLLAYSGENSVVKDTKQWSPAFKAWLEMYNKQISEIRKENIVPDKKISDAWTLFQKTDDISLKSSKSVSPLLTTTWNQDCGYNAQCPADPAGPCNRVYTGCVATAMAQVMRYMEYPSAGNGNQCYNTGDYGELCADFESAEYDYASMPNNSGNSEVAELMYHCGVAVYMNYSPSGSGAYSHNAVNAWRDFFGYKNHLLIYKSNYDESDWVRILKNEIDNDRPLYYAGFGSGGHAFVFDGYDDSDRFHINWGWGGSQNGYFYVNDLTPGGSDFSDNQQAIVGAIPSPDFTDLDFSSAVNLSCATAVSADISTGVNHINYYKNTYPSAVGKELLYTFSTSLPGRIRVKITNNSGGNVNTFLLSHPHQDSLIVSGQNGLIADNSEAGTYYLVAEGEYGTEPTFDIELICPTVDADLIFTNANVSPEFIESLMPNVVFSSKIKNIGNTDAGASNIEYYLSDDDVFDGSDILLGSDVVPGTDAGESINFSSVLNMPDGLLPGNYYVIFNLDPDNVVPEADDDNFASAGVQVPDTGVMNCTTSLALQDGLWHYGNTPDDGENNIESYWSASDMTGPEVIHSFTPDYNGFAKISFTEKNQGTMNAMIFPICNENTYLTNVWFAEITDTIGYADFYVTAGTEYFAVVDGQDSASGDYAIKADLPEECPDVPIEISGNTDLCDGDAFPSFWTNPGANSYQWYKNGDAIPEQTTAWFSPKTPGTYHLEMTENGCTNASEPINIQMSFPPDTAQIAHNGDLEFCYGGSVELYLSNTVSNPTNWALNGELIEGAVSNNYFASEAGTYSLITTNNSCSVSSENSILTETNDLPKDINEKRPMPSDLVEFYYTFEKDNTDYSGNNNPFSCWDFEPTNDRFDNFWQARHFTAEDVFGYSSAGADMPNEFTLSLWFKTNTAEGGVIAGFFDNPWNASQMEAVLYMSDNGKLHFYMSNSGTPAELVSADSYNDDNWHLVTFRYNGNMTMSIDREAELLNANSVTKETFYGYWTFAGTDLPADAADMPASKYFNGAIDDIIGVYEANEYIDKYNYSLPKLGIELLSETDNCETALPEIKIINSELNTEYRLWNETGSQWISDAETGSYGDITITANTSLSEISEIKIYAQNSHTACEQFLDTSLSVNVFQDRSPEVSISSDAVSGLCPGSTVNFEASAEKAGSNPQYEWFVNGTAQNHDSALFSTALSHGNYEIYCLVNSSNPCAAESSANSNLVNISAADDENPALTLQNISVYLNAEGRASLTAFDIVTSASDNCGIADTVLSQYNFDCTDTEMPVGVTVSLTDSSGNIAADTAEITVVDDTAPQITCPENQSIYLADGQTTYIANGTEFDPISSADNCGTATLINDYNNAETLAGAEFPEGTKTLSWTATDRAGNNKTCIFDLTVNASSGMLGSSEEGFRLYPNPAKDIIKIVFSSIAEQKTIKYIRITDISGRTIQQFEIPKSDTAEHLNIDLSEFPPGIYILKITGRSANYTEKIIKQ